MKRDMELMRKILFTLEDTYKPGDGLLFGLPIPGYSVAEVAEHCDFLFQRGFISQYEPMFADDTIQYFRIGNITDIGYDYLELVKNDEVWKKTNEEVEKQRLPKTIEIFAKIAGIFVGNTIKEINS